MTTGTDLSSAATPSYRGAVRTFLAGGLAPRAFARGAGELRALGVPVEFAEEEVA